MKYNKGEWSEAYAFIKLIGEGHVFASDENLNKLSDKLYPILKVFKDEIEKYYEPNADEGIVNIINYNGDMIASFDSSTFIDIMKNFLNEIGITSFKGSSAKKEDLKMEIFDIVLDTSDVVTFSIKSELGSKPTLLNASKLTNFTFEVEGMSDDDFNYLNSINKEFSGKWLKIKFNKIFEGALDGKYKIKLFDDKTNILYQNLRLIDSNLPQMLAFILFYFYSHEKSTDIQLLTNKLIEFNPLRLEDEEKDIFYKKKMFEFIEAVTFGMMPNIKWDGSYEISGGLLTVKKDGEILCHHIFYDNDALKNYLFKNTKLESPSTSRHEYGLLFKKDNRIFFKLNLQLRFK